MVSRVEAVWHDMSSLLLLLVLVVLRAHLRSRGGHHRCIHYNAVSPHEDWMHPPALPPSLDAASDGRTDDGLTTAVGWRVVVVAVGWDSWDGRTLEISRACSLLQRRNRFCGQCRSCSCSAQSRSPSHGRRGRRHGGRGGGEESPIRVNEGYKRSDH